MSKSLALGFATDLTGLGSSTGCICPSVSERFALGCVTDLTGPGSVAISVYPSMSKSLALGFATDLTGLGSGTGCIYPLVLVFEKRGNFLGLGCFTNRTRKGLFTGYSNFGSLGHFTLIPNVLKSCALGCATGTRFGRGAGCGCPRMSMRGCYVIVV